MKWWSMKGQGVILTPSLPNPLLSFSQHPFLGVLVEEAVDNPLSLPPCSLQRERIPTQCEEGGNDTFGFRRKSFFPHHPHFTISFFPSLQLLSLINCRYVAQNYLNVIDLFLISSSLVIS